LVYVGLMTDPVAPWRWPDTHWRSLVGRVRAGRALRPAVWKDGARCAVALSFDSDHETNELRDGGGSLGRLSWGEYGSRVGVERIRAILRRHGVPATFFVPAVSALLHPEEQRALVAEGHEVGMHGWIHEVATSLCAEEERELMLRAAETLEAVTGQRPVGLRAPSFEISRDTLAIAEEMGLSYDASLMADDDCHELLLDGQRLNLVEIPASWVRDDGAYLWTERFSGLRPYTAPADVLDIFRRELEAAHAEGGLFQLLMHPHVIGYRSRIWILDELLRHARSLGGVWFATHAEVAAWCRASAF
jgi:peptidoglycan/xylan/chitin deacetylase (PgdA/CDA1 family)